MAKKRKGLTVTVILLAAFALIGTTRSEKDGEVKKPSGVDSGTVSSSVSETVKEENAPVVEKEEKKVDAKEEISIEKTVLYEAGGITVTATGFEEGWMGPEVKILVENNTAKDILITAEDVSANGYMISLASLYTQVSAGKKATDTLTLSSTELKESGVETIADIQFFIKVSDSATWTEIDRSELITLSTSAKGYSQPIDDTGDILYDEKGIKIVCKGLKKDVIWDGMVVFYMENNGGHPITVYAEDVSVNGFMQDASIWSSLRDGTRIVDGLSLLDMSDLELRSIDDVNNIELRFRIINSENWNNIVTTDVISLNFN